MRATANEAALSIFANSCCSQPRLSARPGFSGESRNAISANAVGSTQLAVLGVQPHPRYESFCEWMCDFARRLRTNRIHGLLSRGKSSHSHFSPAATFFADWPSAARTEQASEVIQLPARISAQAGHDPSESCVDCR